MCITERFKNIPIFEIKHYTISRRLELPQKPIYEAPEVQETHQVIAEAGLLKAIAKGDQEAFTILFENRHAKFYTFALKLTRSKALAEEIIQDVFLNIWINRANLETILNFDAYLNRITRNLSLNALRNIAKDKVLTAELEADEHYPDHSTEQLLAYNDTMLLMKAAIAKLSPQQQMVYTLCHKEGLTYEQAALKLNIAPSTVHSHMKAALFGLRKHFKKMGIPLLIVGILLP